MFEEGKLKLLEHIRTHPVGTERQVTERRQTLVIAHMIVHVRTGIMYQEPVLGIQQLNIPGGKIQPVGDQRFAVDQIEISQPHQQIFCIMMVAVGDIVAVFRRVNMQPAAGCLQGLV